MASTYDVGDVVRVTGVFTSTAGTPINPTKVTFAIESSTGISSRTSTMISVINPSVGTFYTDIYASVRGVWEYRITSTGTLRTSTQRYFTVRTQRAVP